MTEANCMLSSLWGFPLTDLTAIDFSITGILFVERKKGEKTALPSLMGKMFSNNSTVDITAIFGAIFFDNTLYALYRPRLSQQQNFADSVLLTSAKITVLLYLQHTQQKLKITTETFKTVQYSTQSHAKAITATAVSNIISYVPKYIVSKNKISRGALHNTVILPHTPKKFKTVHYSIPPRRNNR